MKQKKYLPALILTTLLCDSTQAATFDIGIGSFSPIFGIDGTTELVTGSIIQLGYFKDIDSAINPSTYTPAQWNSFTAISGIDSLNSAKITNINNALGTGTFSSTVSYDTTTDNLPASYGARLGIRIFEAVDSTTAANYNTVAADLDTWILNDMSPTPPPTTPSLVFNATTSGLAWQDPANAFKTTLTAVPEPSSFALLGLGGVALLFRRRK